MKKIWMIICTITVSFSIAACSRNLTEEKKSNIPKVSESISNIQENENILRNMNGKFQIQAKDNSERDKFDDILKESKSTELAQVIIEEEKNMFDMEIGEQNFSAILYDNETTRALIEQFPMTLNMEELNGNEKYYYLSDSLPTNASRPSSIHTGDFMLYGNNCLVLFYESFSTFYNYTPLGRIDNSDGLAEALGSSNVQIIFRVK